MDGIERRPSTTKHKGGKAKAAEKRPSSLSAKKGQDRRRKQSWVPTALIRTTSTIDDKDKKGAPGRPVKGLKSVPNLSERSAEEELDMVTQQLQQQMGRLAGSSSSSTTSEDNQARRQEVRENTGPITVCPRPGSAHPVRTPSTAYSTDDEHYCRRTLRERLGPTMVSPRPMSAHPHKRPELYTGRKYSVLTEDGIFGRCESPVRSSRSREEYEGVDESGGSGTELTGPANGREVSFVVSLPRKDDGTPPPNEDEGSPSEPESRTSRHSKDLSRQLIMHTKRQSSIVTHTDSLDLLDQIVSPSLTPRNSMEMIERVRRDSSIVRHVDSLVLMEHSKQEMMSREDKVMVCVLSLVRVCYCIGDTRI